MFTKKNKKLKGGNNIINLIIFISLTLIFKVINEFILEKIKGEEQKKYKSKNNDIFEVNYTDLKNNPNCLNFEGKINNSEAHFNPRKHTHMRLVKPYLLDNNII